MILLAEADEEAAAGVGIQWLIANAYDKIDAEFAINEGGFANRLESGRVLYNIQTAEKIPTRVKLIARGTAGHGSVPRPDNPVVRLAQAVARLAAADQPVRFNATTREYFRAVAKLPEYAEVSPLVAQLEDPARSDAARRELLRRQPFLASMLATTVSPTMLQAGVKVNVIPTVAEAQIDVRRLPNETREEVIERFRKIIDDAGIEMERAGAVARPATEPSSRTSALYLAMEQTLGAQPGNPVVLPMMIMGATDGAELRARGMGVYGIPLFPTAASERRAHGNDERVELAGFTRGVGLLREVVRKVAE